MPEHLLVKIGKERFNDPERHSVHLVDDQLQNDFLNDIDNYPQAYVLACLMDRQIKAERAWAIPYRIKNIVGSFDIDDLVSITLGEYKNVFYDNKLHRFNDTMAEILLVA
jgi:endonuclease III